MKNKSIYILFICFVMLLSSFSVGAKTAAQLREELEAQKKKSSGIKKVLDGLANDKAKTAAEKEGIENEQKQAEENIDYIRATLTKNKSDIEETTAALAKTQIELDEYGRQYSERIRYVYEQGRVSYVEVIFGAKDFSDFLNRLTLMQDIMKFDKGIIDELKVKTKQIAEYKQKIEDFRQDQLELLELEKEEKTRLDTAVAKKEAILDKIETDEGYYKKQLEIADAAMEQTSREIQNALSSGSYSAPANYAGGTMAWPVPAGGRVTSRYGYRTSPAVGMHTGIDIAIATGNDIVAANDGVVVIAGWSAGGYGNYVVIDHGGGYSTLYGHASKLYVSKGQSVKRGQTIAAIGSTGFSTGPHLHFEVRRNGAHTNPEPYIT